MRRAHSGRARINLRHPEAMGECDLTGFWYSRAAMRPKMEWAGNRLINTGLLVGPDQLDKPQEQYRTLILPPDPRPVPNPRPSPHVTGIGPVMSIRDRPYSVDDYGTDGYGIEHFLNPTGPTTPGNYNLTQLIVGGASLPPYYPLTKYDVLTEVSAITGIPIPQQLFDRSIRIATQNQSYMIMGTQPLRGWFLVYNPTNPQAQMGMSDVTPPMGLPAPVAVGSPFGVGGFGLNGYATQPGPQPPGTFSVTWGNRLNLILGPGEAFFGAYDQGLGHTYRGALAVIGLLPGMDFWAWESGSPWLWLTDDYGNLVTDDDGQAILVGGETGTPGTEANAYFTNDDWILGLHNGFSWPGSSPPGPTMWNNDGVASVGRGSDPGPGPHKPLMFGVVTPLELQYTRGDELPWIEPATTGQLWNPGGSAGGAIHIARGRVIRPYGRGRYGTSRYGFWPRPSG